MSEPSKEAIAREAMIKLQEHYIQIDPRIALPIIQSAIEKALELDETDETIIDHERRISRLEKNTPHY